MSEREGTSANGDLYPSSLLADVARWVHGARDVTAALDWTATAAMRHGGTDAAAVWLLWFRQPSRTTPAPASSAIFPSA